MIPITKPNRICDRKAQGLRLNICFGLLGFGCGLPYPLLGATLGLWLFEEKSSIILVSLFSWVLAPYSLKPIWARFIDTKMLPFFQFARLTPLSWIFWSQIGCLVFISIVSYFLYLKLMIPAFFFATLAAFFGASQDCAVDSLRIRLDCLYNSHNNFLSFYQIGYRVALLINEGLLLIFAHYAGWPLAYFISSLLIFIPTLGGVYLTFYLRTLKIPSTQNNIIDSVNTFGFVSRIKFIITRIPLVTWAFVASYRLPDLLSYPYLNPSYVVSGLSNNDIAFIHSAITLPVSLFSLLISGFIIKKYGLLRTTMLGGLIQFVGFSCISFCVFYHSGFLGFCLSNILTAFATSMTGISLVIIMSNVSKGDFPAFDYSILITIYSFSGKFISGAIGIFADSLSRALGSHFGLATIFAASAIIGAFSLIFIRPALYKSGV